MPPVIHNIMSQRYQSQSLNWSKMNACISLALTLKFDRMSCCRLHNRTIENTSEETLVFAVRAPVATSDTFGVEHNRVDRSSTVHDGFAVELRWLGASAYKYFSSNAFDVSSLMLSSFQWWVGRFCSISMIPWKKEDQMFYLDPLSINLRAYKEAKVATNCLPESLVAAEVLLRNAEQTLRRYRDKTRKSLLAPTKKAIKS